MNKKAIIGIGTCLLTLGAASMVSAGGSWSESLTFDVKGVNSSTVGNWDTQSKNKVTDDAQASFHSIARSSWSGMDGRVVNSDGVSRSSWARNLDPGITVDVDTTASNGYAYVPEISSDITQIGTDSISFKWSPDNPD
ncbi:hypothetical protein [Enterococcus nangangensis]|uniref:hypothetical protein n=1 Tax=Enterococcus nangangensis TaxID=2559926 RepID=UPI0010F91814|nr:hypothetical protein [Enterococcus nangangensis]